MKRRTNRILSILLVVLSLALLAGAGFLLVQVLPQKAPQEEQEVVDAFAENGFEIIARGIWRSGRFSS